MAANSLRLLDDCDIVAAHIFPFSPRAGTPAARMPQLEREIGQGPRRPAARGGGASGARAGSTRWSGPASAVLIENHGKGHSDGFAPVQHRRRAARRHRAWRDHRPHEGDHIVGVWA